MTAHQGRNWRLSPSLIAMEAEADAIAPNRSRASDGSIGDQEHAARLSQHNPADDLTDADLIRWVCAIDLTHDPAGGFHAHDRARQIAANRDPRVRYLISDGEIWNPGSGKWSPYTGPNKHRQHMHASIFNTATARDLTAPWWPTAAPTPTMPIAPTEDIEMYVRNIENGEVWALTHTTCKLLDGPQWNHRVQHEQAAAWPVNSLQLLAMTYVAGRVRV